MEGLIMAGQLLLGLGLLVFIHELGHYLAAIAFGIRVEKFYIFFDFGGWKLFSKTINGTEYGLGWFPLGGYVKIAGMVDESMDKSFQDKPAEVWEFRSKPAWQRFIVMIAGITMNLILGVFIFAFVLLNYSKVYLPPENVKGGIYAYKLAREMGLQTGDRVLEINGSPPERSRDLMSLKVFFGAELKVDRNGETKTIDLPDDLFLRFKGEKDYFIAPDNFSFTVDTVTSETARSGGLKKGDRIISLNEEVIDVYGKMREHAIENSGKTVELKVLRNTDSVSLNLPVNEKGLIGFGAAASYPDKRDQPSEIPKPAPLPFSPIDTCNANRALY